MPDVVTTAEVARAIEEFRTCAEEGNIAVVGDVGDDGGAILAIDLSTKPFSQQVGGLPVLDVERLYVSFSSAYPSVPPTVCITHDRWDGYPHVLQGARLCLYLDPDREWNPLAGVRGFLERLWEWFEDAIGNRFDPATALFQPVGGVLHRTRGTPTLVATEPLGVTTTCFDLRTIELLQRNTDRIDVVSWSAPGAESIGFPAVQVLLSDALPRGGGAYLSDLAVAIRGQDARAQRRQFLARVTKLASRLRSSEHLYVLIAVPNRHLHGEARHHLIAWRLRKSAVSLAVAHTRRRHKPEDVHPEDEPRVEWVYVDDNRAGVSARRDQSTPFNWFIGKTVDLWGCGALGSWIAEQLVRVGAAKVLLRDIGYVTKGLLVRQNYTEHDIGRPKVDALAARLRTLNDQATVVPQPGLAQQGLDDLEGVDLIVDCTVNTATAAALEHAQRARQLPCPVAQLATDNETATLGILTVSSPNRAVTNGQLDVSLRMRATSDVTLAPFRTFWDPNSHPPLTPTIGCSIPTFVGSIADAIAVTSIGLGLIAHVVSRDIACGYLFASAHAPFDVPPRTPVAYAPNDDSSPVIERA